MKLVPCPACKTEVSDQAPTCMKCGHILRKPTRSFFGKLIKLAFIAFNALMLIWLVAGMNAASEHVASASSEAQRAGAEIGTAIGASMVIGVWAAGAIVLGLFVLLTRPKLR